MRGEDVWCDGQAVFWRIRSQFGCNTARDAKRDFLHIDPLLKRRHPNPRALGFSMPIFAEIYLTILKSVVEQIAILED